MRVSFRSSKYAFVRNGSCNDEDFRTRGSAQGLPAGILSTLHISITEEYRLPYKRTLQAL